MLFRFLFFHHDFFGTKWPGSSHRNKEFAMSGSSSELQEVQEKLRTLNTEYDKLSDEWRGKLAAQQDEFQGEKHVRPKKIQMRSIYVCVQVCREK